VIGGALPVHRAPPTAKGGADAATIHPTGDLVRGGGLHARRVALVPGLARASGGGGCGGPVTDERGTTVPIRNYCFTPTILRVQPGASVTWINRDRAPHTVLGANASWGGYEVLKRGRAVTHRFTRPGVYPYVCTYHVGMVGAVVVGDAAASGAIGTTTAAGPVTPATSSTAETEAVTSSPVRVQVRGAWVHPVVAVAAFALFLAAAAALVLERRRRAIAS
jgi:plastocyanin